MQNEKCKKTIRACTIPAGFDDIDFVDFLNSLGYTKDPTVGQEDTQRFKVTRDACERS